MTGIISVQKTERAVVNGDANNAHVVRVEHTVNRESSTAHSGLMIAVSTHPWQKPTHCHSATNLAVRVDTSWKRAAVLFGLSSG